MSPLEQLHADQHDDLTFTSDHQAAAFYAELSTTCVQRDLLPRTAIELRHLARARKATT